MSRVTNAANPSGTHLPYLARLLQRINGPILELGSGFFSTPLLYWHAVSRGQQFRSYETNKSWADTMGAPVEFVGDWSQVNMREMRWSLVFIDHGQSMVRKRTLPPLRGDHAIAVKDNTDYVVLHDTEPQHEETYGLCEVWSQFKHRINFTDILPHTTVLSNTHDLDWLK